MKFSLGRQARSANGGTPPLDGLDDQVIHLDPAPQPVFVDEEPPATFVPKVQLITVPLDEDQECVKCGETFGRRASCRNCSAPRRRCAVCGSRIFAGAMTCIEHSGLAPDPDDSLV